MSCVTTVSIILFFVHFSASVGLERERGREREREREREMSPLSHYRAFRLEV